MCFNLENKFEICNLASCINRLLSVFCVFKHLNIFYSRTSQIKILYMHSVFFSPLNAKLCVLLFSVLKDGLLLQPLALLDSVEDLKLVWR